MGAADTPLLRTAYAHSRRDEMALTGWADDQIQAFLDSQFAFQAAHYAAQFGDGDHSLILLKGRPVGRVWLHDTTERRLLVDIALLREFQGQGVGTAVIRKAQAGARRLGLPMILHVLPFNTGARRLYERLGFAATVSPDSDRIRMVWTPPVS